MDNFYSRYPVTGGGGVTVYPNIGSFPITAATGALGVAADTGFLYEWSGVAWVMIAGPIGTYDVLIPDGTAGAPGLAFKNQPDTGIFRIASPDGDMAMSQNGVQFFEAKYAGGAATIINFGPVGTISDELDTPWSVLSTYNDPQNFVFTNQSQESNSSTTITVGNGLDAHFTTLENFAWNTLDTYLGGGSAMFASPNMTQLVIGSERPNSYIAFTIGGRVLADERMRLTATALTMGTGVQLLAQDGTASLPGIAFASQPNSGLVRLGTDDIALSVKGKTALEALWINSSNTIFAFNSPIGNSAQNPLSVGATVNNAAFFNYSNLSNGAASSTVFVIGSGPDASAPITIENLAYNTTPYSGGGGVLSASSSLTQLIIASEYATGSIRFTIGGRVLADELMKLDGSALTLRRELIFDVGDVGTVQTMDSSTADTWGILVRSGTATGGFSSGAADLLSGDADLNSGSVGVGSGATQTGVSGDLYLITGGGGLASGPGGTGTVHINSGAANNGNSGDVLIAIGTALGTRGQIILRDGSEGTAGYVWTSTDTQGRGAWAAASGGSATNKKELVTLAGGDITNQYIDLTHVAKTDSIDFLVKGGGVQIEGASYDYSVNYTGGAGGNTRITFLNDLATGGLSALVAGDIVVTKYEY